VSYGQAQLWFLDQINPGSVAYHVVKSVRLTGPLNEPALVAAFDGLVRRHEALRTTFLSIDGEPRCRIGPEPTTKLASIDLEDVPRTEREAAIVHQVTDETVLPFDLQQGPLLRAKLFRIDALDHVLLLAMHPIVCDGGSIGVMLRDLAALYQERASGPTARLPELARQYRDFAAWQRSSESDSSFETALVYWKRQLAGAPSSVALPIAKPAEPNRAGRTHQKEFRLSPGRLAAIRAVGQRHGCSLFVTLLAAFQSLLHRCSGQSEIVVGSPFAGRSRFEAENQVGFYVNFLPLKADFASDPTFSEILVQVRDTLLAAMETEDVPLLKIVEATQPVRQPGRSPLFNVLVVLEEASDSSWQVPGVDCRVETPVDAEAMVDLSLALKETAGELHGALKYDALIFDAPDISRLLVHFQTLLDAVAADPQMRVAELPLMPETERRRVLVEWNDTSLAYPRDRCLHQLIEAQADRTPNAIALVAGEKRFTYRELNSAANRLAHHLTRLGAGPERRVGIFMDRSRAMVIGLLAILKTGAAYVPLDPAYPRDRIAFIVEDADCGILLTEDRHLSALPNHRAQVVCLDSLDVSEESEGDWVCTGSPGDLAYVIFTSGSTGRPKGVAIEHRSVVALVEWARTVFGPEELAGVLFATSICFDLSVFELFVPLSLGGTVLLADNILQLPTLPARSEVKLVNTVPSALAELLRSSPLPPSVQTVNLAGEPLPAALVERIYAESNVQKVYDLYGPTEDTVYSTFTLRTRGGPTTIGRPIANTQAYILDRHLQPQPIGVPGELFLGGEGLARGYLNRTDLTAEKFVSNPFDLSPGARLYRTGDLARYLADGNIEFLGRLDHQVKIRGFRIELGEIEAVLETSPGVRQALVMAQDEDGENCLVAYVEGESPEAVAPVTLRAFIRSRLPEHMIPSFIVGVPAMPLTPNGKVDRRALAALPKDRVRTAGGQTPPSTPTEIRLAEIWGEILGLKTVAANENFFELGGHSLKAVRMVHRINRDLAAGLGIVDIFNHPTIEKLAHCLASRGPGTAPTARIVPLRQGSGTRPVFFLYAGPDEWNLASLFHEAGPVFGIQVPWRKEWHAAAAEGRTSALPTLEELVAPYTAEIRKSPYASGCILAGFSFAGLMAHEAARQLRCSGHRVDDLFLFDAWAYDPTIFQIWNHRVAQLWRQHPVEGPWKEALSTFRSNLRATWKLTWEVVVRQKRRLWAWFQKLPPEPHMHAVTSLIDDEGEGITVGSMLAIYQKIFADLRAKPLPGSVALFRAIHAKENELHGMDESLGWNRLHPDGVEIVPVEGEHHSMFQREPHRAALAKAIGEVMARRNRGSS
jgi:amino acid adenylation domain-containing protein